MQHLKPLVFKPLAWVSLVKARLQLLPLPPPEPAAMVVRQCGSGPLSGRHQRRCCEGGAAGCGWHHAYLCSSASHTAVRLAFLGAVGKLRQPPQLWKVICPADAEICTQHGQQLDDLQVRGASLPWCCICSGPWLLK